MNILNIDFKNDQFFVDLFRHVQDVWNCTLERAQDNKTKPFIVLCEKLDRLFDKNYINSNISVALVDGCNTSNGHAMVVNGKSIAWISVSNYQSEKSIKVFTTHEIIHAIHYKNVPEYYFFNCDQKNHVGRQLVTEGIATFLTQKLLNISNTEALWADYLSVNEIEDVMKRYENSTQEIANSILKDWDNTESLYFYASNFEKVNQYRSGYYLGRLLIENLAMKYEWSLNDVLTISREDMDRFFIKELKDIIKL